MVKGIVDRIEGNYAVVEFSPPIQEPLLVDINMENFGKKVSAGDVIHIFEVNGINLNDESRCVYKDINRREVLQKFLEPLERVIPCEIVVDAKETEERSSSVKSMISGLFN